MLTPWSYCELSGLSLAEHPEQCQHQLWAQSVLAVVTVMMTCYSPGVLCFPGQVLIAPENNRLFSSIALKPCQSRSHMSYSWWLMERNPTNICAMTNQMKRLMAKYIWHQPVVEFGDGLHSSPQLTFHYCEYPFEKKPLKKTSVFCFESSTASFHASSCGVGTLLSLAFRKGQVKVYVVPHPESIRFLLKAASAPVVQVKYFSPHFVGHANCVTSGLHLWYIFLVDT